MGNSDLGIARLGAAVVGVVYVAAGVLGFLVTGFGAFTKDTTDSLLGFDINPFHNFVHLAIGAYLLLVAKLGRTAAEGALIGGGLVYLLAAFLGFDNRLTILSIHSANASDNYLHVASGAAALLLGLISASMSRSQGSGQAVQQR